MTIPGTRRSFAPVKPCTSEPQIPTEWVATRTSRVPSGRSSSVVIERLPGPSKTSARMSAGPARHDRVLEPSHTLDLDHDLVARRQPGLAVTERRDARRCAG